MRKKSLLGFFLFFDFCFCVIVVFSKKKKGGGGQNEHFRTLELTNGLQQSADYLFFKEIAKSQEEQSFVVFLTCSILILSMPA